MLKLDQLLNRLNLDHFPLLTLQVRQILKSKQLIFYLTLHKILVSLQRRSNKLLLQTVGFATSSKAVKKLAWRDCKSMFSRKKLSASTPLQETIL